jgi:hypothetical protein
MTPERGWVDAIFKKISTLKGMINECGKNEDILIRGYF